VPAVPGARLAARAAPSSRREERRLVRDVQRGSTAALEELFRREWPRAYRAAYLVVHDAAAAEDIAQEAFLAAVRAIDRFDRRRPFGPWMHRIVVNRAIDVTRARALRREVDAAAAHAAEAPPDPPATPLSDDVVGALRELSPEHRAVVVLRFVCDYTPGEIAHALDMPRGTVNSRLRRALDRLGEVIER
jgi:RNA polymerase sigma-70 factor (ECF subfamily)